MKMREIQVHHLSHCVGIEKEDEMQFKQGVRVFTASDENVGTVDRVVLDPLTKKVTHIVVRKGFLFVEDKVVPIGVVDTATEDRVTLRDKAGDLQALPYFEESHYIPLTREELGIQYAPGLAFPLLWYPDVGTMPRRVETERNIPDNAIPLREGAHVISADEKDVGNIERIFTDPGNDRVSHFVIAQGFLTKERKLIPINWVLKIREDEIRLAVSSRLLENLKPYQEVAQP